MQPRIGKHGSGLAIAPFGSEQDALARPELGIFKHEAQADVREIYKDQSPGTVFKGDNRIWAYDHTQQSVEAIYDFSRASVPNNVLSGVDNLTVSQWGDVLVAKDGGKMDLN